MLEGAIRKLFSRKECGGAEFLASASSKAAIEKNRDRVQQPQLKV
jgi:hypothetical protein